jgi:predicted glycosyltransferase
MSLIYLYSHDGEGLGHLRRNLNIARSVTRKLRRASCLLLTGSAFPDAFGTPERCDFVKIPTLEKTVKGTYVSPLETLSSGLAHEIRASMLETTVRAAPPDLFIVDKHPQGLNGELLPALRWLRKHSPKTRIVLGLRDILDDPEAVEKEWRETGIHDVLHDAYDRIWMYTDQRVFSTADVYSFEPDLKKKGCACGYVVQRPFDHSRFPQGDPTIVATVGGGRDGFSVLSAVVRSASNLRNEFRSLRLRVFAGPLMPEKDFARLRAQSDRAGGWVKLDRFSTRYLRRIRRASAVVTMGGYNSVLECVAIGKPTVVVPRELPRKEQLIRAQVFENLGFVRVVRQNALGGTDLDQRLAEILERRWAPAPRQRLNLQGYKRILHDIGVTLN